jgi:hypothetical protein
VELHQVLQLEGVQEGLLLLQVAGLLALMLLAAAQLL